MILLLLFVASSTWCWHWWSHWVECLDQAALHSMWCALIKLKPGPDRWGPSMLNFQLACWQMRELVHIHSMSTRSSNSRSMWSPVSVSWVVILAHYANVITFCYLNTIPKHINDMEDLLSHPIWCLSFVAFALISLLSFYFFSFIFHIFSDSIKCNLWKKNREENKNQHKSVSWQPMVTCKHNMAHCSFAYVKKMGGKYS